MPRFAPAALVVLLAVAAAGCESHRPPGTPAFQDGYRQGCASGYSMANRPRFEFQYVRDEALFAGNAEYREGWHKGFTVCYEEETRFPHSDSGNRIN